MKGQLYWAGVTNILFSLVIALFNFTYFFNNYYDFRDVSGCVPMFRDVPECSEMFRDVPAFIDGAYCWHQKYLYRIVRACFYGKFYITLIVLFYVYFLVTIILQEF